MSFRELVTENYVTKYLQQIAPHIPLHLYRWISSRAFENGPYQFLIWMAKTDDPKKAYFDFSRSRWGRKILRETEIWYESGEEWQQIFRDYMGNAVEGTPVYDTKYAEVQGMMNAPRRKEAQASKKADRAFQAFADTELKRLMKGAEKN